MEATKRQRAIMASVREHGLVRIQDLARDMDVSEETIRRDIRPLVAAGEIGKRHGSVSALAAGAEAPFERRMRENAAEKRAIARHVAAMIGDGDSVMLDTGTTTSMLARELLSKRDLTIVTNSSDIARTLAIVNGNRVVMAGGELNGDNGAAFGRTAIEFIERFNTDFAIISIAAVSAAQGLMDYHLDEAEFARAVLRQGKRRLVVTDHTKFDRSALVTVCGFDALDEVVTDREPPEDIGARLAASGVICTVAATLPAAV
jgi:DeoR family glycerol-3-phosphate regulon repressor